MKNVLIGITGSIAAYKTLELIRMFKRQNYNVKVILTPAALNFVTPLTVETLSKNPAYYTQFEKRKDTEHIELAKWADVFVIAPISANTISKFANGIADNLLTSVFCAYLGHKKPVVLAPAMNVGMWENPFVKENLKKLKENNANVLDVEEGFLACNENAKGRMCSLDKIFNAAVSNRPLVGKKIVITAGGTKEAIDPVRYISNASSGKMGAALAKVALELGANVELITTVSQNINCKITEVQSALDMQNAVYKSFIEEKSDILIMAAAVSDFRVKNAQDRKITKKENGENLTLELVQNPDILKNICSNKSDFQKVVGFCLSTENTIENAKAKIKSKGCDFIVANEAKTALGKDENEVWIIDKNENVAHIEKCSKEKIARSILEKLYD